METKQLVIGFQNNGYFKARLVIKEISKDKSSLKTTRLHHNETLNVAPDHSVRVRVQVKKGIKVFVIGGYYYLDNQYVIPKGSFGRIDFAVSGTVHYESIKWIPRDDFVCAGTISTRESRKAACSVKECRIALIAFHENVAKRLRQDQEKWEKEKKCQIEKQIKEHEKKITEIKSHIDMLISADLHEDSSSSDEDEDELSSKAPCTTTQNLNFAEEMIRKGSVELDVCAEVIEHLESRVLYHQNEITTLKTKYYFGIMAEENRFLKYYDYCGGSSGVYFAFRGFHLEILKIGFSVRTENNRVQIEFKSFKLRSVCHTIRIIAEKGTGVPNLQGDDVTISLDATMKMELQFEESNSSKRVRFERKPCEHCGESVDAYSRQCVECGLNCCRTHKKIFMSKMGRKTWRCKDRERCKKRRVLTCKNKQWHSTKFDFNVLDLQIRGLHIGIPQSLLNWAIKSYLPSTVRDAIVNLIPIEFAEYLTKCNKSVNDLSGEINLNGAPLDVLNSLFKLGSSLRVSDLDNVKVSNDPMNRDALNYLGITAKQGHLIAKLRRRLGLLNLKSSSLWKECSKWKNIQALIRYEELLTAASKAETARTRSRVVSFWQSAIDYYANEDGIESPDIENIFERVANLSRRPINISLKLSHFNLELNAKHVLEMIKTILLRSLLVEDTTSITPDHQRRKSKRRHSVKSSLQAKRMVEIETSMRTWMRNVEDVASQFFRVASSLKIKIRGGDDAVVDISLSRVLLLMKPEGSLSFREHLMPPSSEAMSLYVDKDWNVDYLTPGDEITDTPRERVASTVSELDHKSKITSGDVLRAFNIQDIVGTRRRSRNLSAVQEAYGTSSFFPTHERLLLLKLGPSSLGTVIQNIEKLKHFLENRKNTESNDLLRLHLLSRERDNLTLDCAPGVAAEMKISSIKFVASPYRLCRYLLKEEKERQEEREEEKDEDEKDDDADTATKTKMRNYAMTMVRLTQTLENMSDVMLRQKSDDVQLSSSPKLKSEKDNLNSALQTFTERYVSSSDLSFDVAFRFEAEASKNSSNVSLCLFGGEKREDSCDDNCVNVIQYRNVFFARDHIEGIRAILSASSSSSSAAATTVT